MADNLNVDLDLQDVSNDESVLNELIEKGGKSQTPFLVDTEKDVSMYESQDIIDYIRDNYAGTAVAKPRVHVGGATCVSCEG